MSLKPGEKGLLKVGNPAPNPFVNQQPQPAAPPQRPAQREVDMVTLTTAEASKYFGSKSEFYANLTENCKLLYLTLQADSSCHLTMIARQAS